MKVPRFSVLASAVLILIFATAILFPGKALPEAGWGNAAFAFAPGCYYEIYVTDGITETRLTDNEADDREPASLWHPELEEFWIVFASNLDGDYIVIE